MTIIIIIYTPNLNMKALTITPTLNLLLTHV
jgi:hypothetical protein